MVDRPDWLEWLLAGLSVRFESGEIFVGALQFALALVITIATWLGLRYANRQFKITNTIKYLEEYRTEEMKRAVNDTRAADRANGPLLRTYGMLTHIMDHRIDMMQYEETPQDWHPDPPRARIAEDEARIKNAKDLKYISNYFDYVGVLIKSGNVDRNLFFRQLCDVTISNWRVLRPYIYYQRLAIRDRSAAEYLESFKVVASKLPQPAAKDLGDMIAAYEAFGPVSAVGGQLWFEWLYEEALAWRRGLGAKGDHSAARSRRSRTQERAADRAALKSAIERSSGP